MEHSSDLKLPFPKRPQVSKNFKCKTMSFVSNHFTVSFSSTKTIIYLYDVKILKVNNGEETLIAADDRLQRKDVMASCFEKLKKLFGGNFCWSGQMLWSSSHYAEPKTIEVQLNQKKYYVVLKKTREVNFDAGSFQNNTMAAPIRQFINILIKRYFKKCKFIEWGKDSKFYNPINFEEIPEYYLQAYTGFKTSCEVYQNYTPKILIDFSSRIIRSDTVLWYLKNQTRNTQEAAEMLEGRSVVANYGTFRMWRIDYVDFRYNPTEEVEITDNGRKRKIALVDYYKERYSLKVTDMTQPLLVNIDKKTKKRFFLLPEFVQMAGLDDKMRKNNNLMKAVAKYTRLNPNERMEQITGHLNPLNNFLSEEFGIKMDQESVVKGYVLDPPKITLGGTTSIIPKGNFQIRDPLFKPATFDSWLFVYEASCKDEANDFLKSLQKCCANFAIKLAKPIIKPIEGRSPEALKETIRKNLAPGMKIVVALFPPIASKPWYEAFKNVCCVEKGVQSQAIISTSLKKNVMSVCSKILLQMNAKIGSEIWMTQKPQGLPEKTMIIGADVFHNTKVGEERKSCIGFCASLNPEFNKFFSKVCFQERMGKEIMTNIGKLVKEAVLKFFNFNNKKFLPEYIIFYRDGVGENQLQTVLEQEIKEILNQLKTIDKDYNFKFAEIIITKRIDDRIFVKEEKNFYNPPAGTVISNDIVSNNFDFFLVSQSVTQGTCTPTHYNVIYDTTGLPQDVFWNLTYSQCYNYYNWSGSVKVPAPAQYAHKLAYLVGQSVRVVPDNKLDETLYYL